MSVYTRELISEQYPADNTPEFFPATMSTEQPVWRVGGVFGQGAYEVLVHDAEAIDYSYASVMPVLKDHDQTEQVGTVERVELVGKSLRGVLRFSKNDDGQEVKQDVLDGIRKSLSIGYQILKAAKRVVDGTPFVYVTRWLPVEVSVVSVPADVNAGFYRSATDAPVVELVDETVEQTAQESAEDSQKVDNTGASDVSIHVNNAESQEQDNALGEQKEEVQQEPNAEDPTKTRAQDVPVPAVEDVEADAAAIAAEAERVQKEAELAAIHESERVENLRSIAKTYHVPDAVLSEYIGDKTKTEADLLSAVRNLKTTKVAVATKKEKNMEFSILSALNDKGSASAEMSRALAEDPRNEVLAANASAKTIFIPATRTLTSKDATSGAELQTVAEGALIEALNPASRLLGLGVTSLTGLNSAVRLPKVTGKLSAFWMGEAPTTGVAASSLTTGDLKLEPKTLMAKTYVTKQLLATQGNKDIEALLRADLMRQLAAEIDNVAFNGRGVSTVAPHGIWDTTGVHTQAFGTPSADAVRAGVDKILKANAAMGAIKFVTTVDGASALKVVETLPSSVNSQTVWTGEGYDGKVLGYYDGVVSNIASSTKGTSNNESVLIAGDFSQFIFAQFGNAITVTVVEDENLASKGLVCLHAMMLVDFGIRHAESFTIYTGFIA